MNLEKDLEKIKELLKDVKYLTLDITPTPFTIL